MSSVVHPGCGLTFTLWSFEIPFPAKPFTIESPMIKNIFSYPSNSFLLLWSFYTRRLFSSTASKSGFFLLQISTKLLLKFCKLLSTWELYFQYNLVILINLMFLKIILV